MELDRALWSRLRRSTPRTLDERDLARLRGLGDPLDLREVEEVYLPLSRLLNLYVAGGRQLHARDDHVPRRDGRSARRS